jgi:hypothetical protein
MQLSSGSCRTAAAAAAAAADQDLWWGLPSLPVLLQELLLEAICALLTFRSVLLPLLCFSLCHSACKHQQQVQQA